MRFFNPGLFRTILLMGGPGSGKSVQARLLGEKYHHVSTGELLRKLSNDPLHPQAQQIKALMQTGALIPDTTLFGLLDKAILPNAGRICLLDGFPRTFKQWALFKAAFGTPMGIIDFHAPRSCLWERLSGRLREDDNPAAIESRLNQFEKEIVPLAQVIKTECKDRAFTVNANQSVEAVHSDLLKALDKLREVPEPDPEFILWRKR